jgi:hypothetical protein
MNKTLIARRITNNSDELGAGLLTVAVFGTLLAVVLFSAYNILPFYYYYFELSHQMEAVIRVAETSNNEELRNKLTYHIRKMEIPVGDDEELRRALIIERENGKIRVSLSYEEVFYITFDGRDRTLMRFPFTAQAEGRY